MRKGKEKGFPKTGTSTFRVCEYKDFKFNENGEASVTFVDGDVHISLCDKCKSPNIGYILEESRVKYACPYCDGCLHCKWKRKRISDLNTEVKLLKAKLHRRTKKV
jgi:hypothetical protein